MDETDFRETLDKLCATNSRNEKQSLIREVQDSGPAISFLSGAEFDDAGLGQKTVLSVARDVYDDSVSGEPTVPESLEQFDGSGDGKPLGTLHNEMTVLAALSGNDQKEHLAKMFVSFEYPSVVAEACLNDLPTGVGDSTIASAMGVKDSLPFYGSVAQIAAETGDPLTEPKVGVAFSPMLAVPESRGQPDNPVAQVKVDGYRAIVHISDQSSDQRVHVFSRSMNDITESLPELQEVDWPAGEYILDGEVIAETGSYSDTSQRIGRKAENVDRSTEMQFVCFDAIVYAGEKLWDSSYKNRHQKIQSMDINTGGNTFQHLPVEEDIAGAKDKAARKDDEGIIVKDWHSTYEFGTRSSNWQKVKLDAETADLQIAGFLEGEGRLDGTLGKVALETADGVYVGDSGSGFSDEQRDEIWNNQDEWLGRTVEIEGRGIGSQGKIRMPIFKRDRSDDGEPDSWERVQEVMKDV